ALPCADEIKATLPAEAFTVHRLLGIGPGSAIPRFNAENPLPLDVVVVDEASMIDLALMAKLFTAVPSTARIVLLGDRDHLASVEAGAALADICHGGSKRAESSNPFQVASLSPAPTSPPVADDATPPSPTVLPPPPPLPSASTQVHDVSDSSAPAQA